jgi:cardiolipin synthase
MPTDLPNLLTLSRIAAIPVLVLLACLRQPWGDVAACVVFSAAAITDYFDGKLARDRQQTTDFGRMLDPIADKLLVSACLLALASVGEIAGWSLWAALVILCREILVSGLREYLAELRVGVPVTRLAKWKTALQLVAVGFLVAGPAADQVVPGISLLGLVLLWLSAILTLYTGWDYFRAGVRHIVDDPR